MVQPDLQIPPQICLSHSIVAGGTFNQHNQINTVRNGERGYARLVENVAPAALHDSGHVVDPPKCHPNTRVAIIDSIIDWTSGANVDLRDKSIVWMKGGAGAGKSAIARSVAERCSELGLLLGTFFFGAADTTRNHVRRLVATLAYQMCIVLPELRDRVSKLVEDDPLIFSRSITTQLTILVVRPLSEALADHSGPTETPRLIIIDGLDECSANIDSQRDLLVALQEATSTTTLIRFLVCSRPENHLNSAFGLPCMVKILHKIFLDNDCSAAQDIRRFFEDKFHAIKEGHIFKHMLPATWPMPEVVRTLVYKSSGQFIYAATVVRYVESPKHRPHQRLDAVFNLRPAFKDLPFTELDSLYRHIISKAEELPTVLDILAFPALYGSFPALEMEVMLQLEKGDVEIMLADILSVVTVHKDTRVKFLHKSLTDFLSDSQRAGDLYRDLSAVRLQHVARSISIFSNASHESQNYSPLWIAAPFTETLRQLDDRYTMTTDSVQVSSEILQAARQFPIFELSKKLLVIPYSQSHFWWSFLRTYLEYMCSVVDHLGTNSLMDQARLLDSTRQMYLEHIRQYCYCVLSVLEKDWSDDWKSHFVYAHYFLSPFLHRQYYSPSRERVEVECLSYYIDPGAFGATILWWTDAPYFNDMLQISYDLTKGIKQDTIFALSASFCLAFLCDERNTSRHRRRKHPWRWRRMNPRRPLPDQMVIWTTWDLRERLGRMKKPFREAILAESHSNRIFTIAESLKSQVHGKRQEWPAYMFLLNMLPRMLPFSGRYEPLVTMCRKKCLASLSQCWPKKSRRARQAIDSYLRRMDAQAEN
ncbi:hypothetical protein CPC08DRAFT_687899 [Agrocybe pediades]|nr:hypothetical protein CPC08DRAFT_687899 [Agrocybe pediades]